MQAQQLFSQFSPAKNPYAVVLEFLWLEGEDKKIQIKSAWLLYAILVLLIVLFHVGGALTYFSTA